MTTKTKKRPHPATCVPYISKKFNPRAGPQPAGETVRRRIQHSRLERDDSNALVALENDGICREVDKAIRWLKAQVVAV